MWGIKRKPEYFGEVFDEINSYLFSTHAEAVKGGEPLVNDASRM